MRQRILAGIILSLMAATSNAFTLDAVDRGWYTTLNLIGHDPSNKNYAAGNSGASFPEGRNFFVFDLSTISTPVTSAQLHLWNPSANEPPFANGFNSADPTETYNIYDVTTSISSLTTTNGGSVSIWQDLGSGTQFASVVVSPASNGTYIDIALNAAGVAYVNTKLGSQLAFGGAITTLNANIGDVEVIFGFTFSGNMAETQLILQPVPLPAAVWLLGSALGVLGGMRRRISS